ncbi:MAG: PKD domain-containing protein [Methanobacteriaceae archaeon]|nr:PKD domain-containing protein [Candidatus Methanorudis spinitermitis]
MLIAIIASLSSVSAIELPMITSKNVYDSEIVNSGKSQYAVVNLNEKISFSVSTNNIDKVDWNFGDNTKIIKTKTKKQSSAVTHTFKKVGTYKVKVYIEGTSEGITLQNTEDFITVKVVKKPDLILTKLNYARKGKNIDGFAVTVKNKGTAASKACDVKMWYKDTKLKKYTKSVKIPALKAGKDTTVLIKFQIPYKYRNYISYVKIDSNNKISESIKSNNQKTLNNLIK